MMPTTNRKYHGRIILLLGLILGNGSCFDNTLISKLQSSENDKTFRLIEEGLKKVVISEQYQNVTLVLGNTGSGKSTFLQWIAGDNTKLIAKEVTAGSKQFIIEDGNRIGSSLDSKTIFPELVVDEKSDSAYYDCPGFSDTRSTSHDVSASYFIKHVTDNVKNVKIVFIVGYPSVQVGIDRLDFRKLLEHAAGLINDIDKFRDSIAIIVTKVDNLFDMEEEPPVLVSDRTIIESIAQFLEKVKDKLELQDSFKGDRRFKNKAIALIEILLKKTNGHYERIGIFRRPTKAGPLKSIKLLQKGKKHVNTILYENLEYTVLDGVRDFGYTISDKSKNEIGSLVAKINDKVWSEVSLITQQIQQQYITLKSQVLKRIDHLLNSDPFVDAQQFEDAEELSEKLDAGCDEASYLLRAVENLNSIKDLALKFNYSITRLGVNTCFGNVENISVQGDFFSFLQLVSDSKLPMKPFASLFRNLKTVVLNSADIVASNVTQARDKISDRIRSEIEEIVKNLELAYVEDTGEVLVRLNDGLDLIKQLVKRSEDLWSVSELCEEIFFTLMKVRVSKSGITNSATKILKYGKNFAFLKIFNRAPSLDNLFNNVVTSFKGLETFLDESIAWSRFLKTVSFQLSRYNVQFNTKAFDTADQGEEGKFSLGVTRRNFEPFLEKMHVEDERLRNISLTEPRLKELNELLNLRLKSKVVYQCSGSGKLSIRGDFVKFRDFIDSNSKLINTCPNLSRVEIFASNTVFIDRNFEGVGLHGLTVIAPEWEVIGTIKINLDGTPGTPHDPPKAADGFHLGDPGKNGLPGRPGGPGGNFLGIVKEVIGAENLTITSNGGDSGAGQDGGNGGEGTRGRDANLNDFENHYDDRCAKTSETPIPTIVYTQVTWRYLCRGQPGGKGGDGGDGGRGVKGGQPSEIKIVELNKSKIISLQSNRGRDGKGGKGGFGGPAGRHGDAFKVHQVTRFVLFIPVTLRAASHTEIIPVDKMSEYSDELYRSLNYTAGNVGNTFHSKLNNNDQLQIPPNVANIVKDYKIYLLENVNNRFNRLSILRFLNKMDDDQNVNSLKTYHVHELVDELLSLEEQLYSHPKEIKKIFYKSMLKEINKALGNQGKSLFSKFNNIDSSYNVQRDKVLAYAYVSVFNKIHDLMSESEPNLVVDLNEYLNVVIEHISSYSRLKEKTSIVQLINESTNMYQKNIDRGIRVAETFITDEILPEIENFQNQISDTIALLLKELQEVQDEALLEQKKLILKKQKLEQSLMMAKILKPLKFIGQTLNFLGTLSGEFSNIIQTGTDFGNLEDDLTRFINDIEAESGSNQISKKNIVHSENLEAIKDAIKKADKKIEGLYEQEKDIYETLIPMLNKAREYTQSVAQGLEGKSHVALDVSKWQVQRSLRDLKVKMQQLSRGLKVEGELARCVEKLEEAMTMLINVYDRIEGYQEKKELAGLIAAVGSTHVSQLGITDQNLTKLINKLDLALSSNILLKEYNIVINALKQHVFPFAHVYLKEIALPSSLKAETDIYTMCEKAIKKMTEIREKLIVYKTSIWNHDKYLYSGWFSSKHNSTKPFYVWENKIYKNAISKLLSGQKIVIKANVMYSDPDKDAIKFNRIEINFHSINGTVQSEIDNKLKGFQISATHLGNSYYRYNNEFYMITSDSQNIQYSYEKDANGEPLHKNNVFKKIESGDLTLSPYGMWEIQLINYGTSFDELKMIEDLINLELVGHGSYLCRGANMSDLNVNEYYTPIDMISVITLK